MRSRCFSGIRCMASLASQYMRSRSRCELYQFTCWPPYALQLAGHHHVQPASYRAPFSTTTTCYRRRHKPAIRRVFQGFRHETPEQRLVREHNLFDPHSREHDVDTLRAPVSSNVTTIRKLILPVAETPATVLEREMLHVAYHDPYGKRRVRNLLEHLICDRKETPNAYHYEALILSNSSPGYGSAQNVHSLLQEMEQQGITMNVNIYTAVLRTMAVHPDIEILEQVIQSCEKLWIALDSEMLHLITAAYLRAGMPEIAMEYLESLEGKNANPQPLRSPFIAVSEDTSGKVDLWLYVLFIHELALRNDWEAVMRMCYRLNDDTSLGIPFAARQLDVPFAFWHWLLTRAADAGEAWVTTWIWDIWVHRAWIRPDTDLIRKVFKVCVKYDLIETCRKVVALYNFLNTSALEDPSKATPLIGDEELGQAASEARKRLRYIQRKLDEMSEHHRRLLTAHWWMFQDTYGIEKETGRKLKVNPWAYLTRSSDPGKSWSRVFRERADALRAKAAAEMRRRNNVAQKLMYAALDHLPREMVKDIESVENCLLPAEARMGADRIREHDAARFLSVHLVANLAKKPHDRCQSLVEESSETPLDAFHTAQAGTFSESNASNAAMWDSLKENDEDLAVTERSLSDFSVFREADYNRHLIVQNSPHRQKSR